MSDLNNLLKFEGKEISQAFEKASIEGKGTPQEVSDRREKALIEFIKKYFPFPFRITKGNILDSYQQRSASIDCLILNPSHPYTTTDDDKFSIIFADGVDSAIELKPELNSDSEIHRALKQIASVKRLKRRRNGLVLLKKHTKEYQETCNQIPCFIFSDSTYENERLLLEKIVDYYKKEKIVKELQFDFIAVNNRFIIGNSKINGYWHLKETTEQGFYIMDLGELTIAGFLVFLNSLPKSEPEMTSSVLKHYLNINPSAIRTYTELNEELGKINESDEEE